MTPRVVVIGAGLSGLVAANELAANGVDVRLVDKGRSVGGRLATRRIGEARLDHGAQFFTVRTPAFQRRVDDWLDRGLVRVWNHGFDTDDGHPRYVATGGMNALAKDLAVGLDVECSTLAFAVRPADDRGWEVAIDDGTARDADAVVLTCPLPQSFALLADTVRWPDDGGEAPHPPPRFGDRALDIDHALFGTEYDRTIGLLVTLDRSAPISESGGVQLGDGSATSSVDTAGEPAGESVWSFVGDNEAKGISPVPAVTFHATAAWSETHWDDDLAELDRLLRQAATPWLGEAQVVEAQVKKWRFATPRSVWPDPCWVSADGTIVLAGDAFAGPRVEGAHNSGLAAAHALID